MLEAIALDAVLGFLMTLADSGIANAENYKAVKRQVRAVRASNRDLKTLAVALNGAGDRDRTGDIQLGKLAFYR